MGRPRKTLQEHLLSGAPSSDVKRVLTRGPAPAKKGEPVLADEEYFSAKCEQLKAQIARLQKQLSDEGEFVSETKTSRGMAVQTKVLNPVAKYIQQLEKQLLATRKVLKHEPQPVQRETQFSDLCPLAEDRELTAEEIFSAKETIENVKHNAV